MIEIKCSKAQFERIMTYFMTAGCLDEPNFCFDGKCLLGKSQKSCFVKNSRNYDLTCEECIKKHIKYIPLKSEVEENV